MAADVSASPNTRDGGLRLPAWLPGVARTLGSTLVTLIGLLALTFMIGRMLPIDPVVSIVGNEASQETYQMVYHQLGLDRPLHVQFWHYVRDMAAGDFGMGLFSGHRVAEDLARVFPATIELATVAIVIGVGLGIPLGLLGAVYRGSVFDHLARVFGLLGYSTPTFWLGLMGLVVFYAMLGWVGGPGRLPVAYMDVVDPVTGFLFIDAAMQGEWEVFHQAVRQIVLPASILGFSSLAYISRSTRSFMLEQLGQEYIVAARAKGQSTWTAVRRHALRNVLVQLVTVVALSYAFLLEGAVLTETVFGWPGFGHYLTQALLAGDMNAVLASVLIIGLIFIGMNLISDILYRVFDPRTR